MDKPRNIIQLHILINIYIKDSFCDRGSDEYKEFIDFVSDVDEMLEQQQFENLGESEKVLFDPGYKGICLTLNVSKDTQDYHVSGRIDFLLVGGATLADARSSARGSTADPLASLSHFPSQLKLGEMGNVR